MLQIADIIQTVLLIIFPLMVLYLERKGSKITMWLSPVLLCYLFGIVAGNIPFIPINTDLSGNISEFSILIAIPVLLFSTNLIRWLKLAPKTVLAFSFNILSVSACSIIFGLMAINYFTDSWKLSGMLVGVYTGGTPNMSAIGIALDVNETFFVLINAADVILGGIYLIFLLTFAKKLLRIFMPDFTFNQIVESIDAANLEGKSKTRIIHYIQPVLISIVGIALCYGIMILLFNGLNIPVLILLITSIGIGFSFIPKFRDNKANYPAGEFFILVFSLSIGTLVDIHQLLSTGLHIISFTALIMFSTIILHYILCALFRIDTDTAIITSVAGIYGPVFVGPVAKALNNKEIIISGITTGLIGYAIGNYLGIALALWLKP